ncbi:Vacuolar protein sorting-associated protein vps5 [Naganishia albida]|nr:Vacuolar protein sorting-associated protein vps5 [Naganishia albida]
MDDNPFANPFADDADPTANPFASSGSGIQSPALASYTSGFDAASRRVSIASAGEHVYPTAASSAGGQADTEESPYLRKLEQDGVISGITSPSAAFQGNPFSSAVSPIARTAQNDDIDAFKGGFYSPPAFSPVNPSSSQDQAFGIGESAVIGSPSQSTNDEGPRRVQGASQATTTHQDDLEALGLAPAADPTSTLKAAFIKHPAPRPRETPGPQEPEQMEHTSLDTASPSTKRTPSIQPATRPAEGTSAGARRRKKVVGISVDNVERERERERERLERERAEREVARKEGEEREKAERERREREGPKEEERRTDAAPKLEENTTTPLNGEPTIPTPESQPIISSTTAEQILLSSDPHQTSQAIAQQLDPTDEDEDGLRTLPPLPASEGNTRTATPEPVTEPPRSTGSPATMRLEKMIDSPSAPHAHSHHPGIVCSHLDPVVTSPLDGSANADVGPGFQSLNLGGSTARDEPRRSASWGRAFDEDDSNEVQPPSSVADGPVSAGWTTELPSGGSLATGGGWTSPGAQGGDGWGAKDVYSTQSPETPIRPPAQRPLSAISIKSPTLQPTAPPVPPKTKPPPAFTIRIHDPTRVGDPIRGHVVYTVSTRTTSPHYSSRESSVLRRFSQFLWLVGRVGANNPGVIVPPVPDKQLSGRFEDQFIETRRAALEKCLNKMANHPVLSLDPDLRLFLESESFEFEVKHRKHETAQSQESKGLLATIGGSIGGPRFVEKDDWFEQKKSYLDSLESQMKGWIKSVEAASKHRLDLSQSISEFADSITALAESDLSMELSQALQRLAGLTLREKETQEDQAKMDVVHLLNTADEYVRWIGSVRLAFASRIKSYFTWQSAEADARRLKMQHEKLRRSGKIAHDRVQPALAEIAEADRRALDAHSDFDAVSRLVKMEFSRYEQERVDEFKHMFERYLDEMIVAQKEMIAAWENYLGMLQRTTGDRPTQRSS